MAKENKAPKKSLTTRSNGKKMSVYSSLVNKSKAKADKRAREKAEDLAKLPKHPVKRFFARLHPKRVFKFIFSKRGLVAFGKFCAACFLIGIIAVGGLFLYYKKDLDAIKLDEMHVAETVNTYLDRNGELLWEDKGDGDYRLVVDGDQISTYMRQATVAIEDKNFYNHVGIDVKAMFRAALSIMTHRGVQGGSTLTQQLIKQVYFSDESGDRTITGIPRKIKEAILAIEVEKMYDKEQIITMYLNESPYGGRRNGVESAARTYFDKSAKDLTLAESAFLAAIPNNPAVLNPYNEYGHEGLIARQRKTLDVMAEMGYITQEQANEAKEVDVLDTVLPEQDQYKNILAPHFVLEVKEQLEQKYGVKTMRSGGFTITTSIDLRAQKMAESAVAEGMKLSYTNGSDNAALASVDVETGQVIAMVGSSNWNAPVYGQVNVATSLMEPGSTIKPILDYTPLFVQRSGQNYGPGTILRDDNIDSIYCSGYQGSCKLRNYTGAFYGNISIRRALANSLNIPAVKALYINGVDNSLEIAHGLGDLSYCAETEAYYGLAIAIGSGCNVKPIEHANAYASLARGGVYKPLTYVLEVKNSSGEVLESWQDSEGERVVDEEVAYMTVDILGDASARNLVFGAQATAAGFKVPGVWTGSKTGTTTTENSAVTKDSLMASFSTSIATVVWNGNHDGSALNNSSNTIVRTIVNEYMGPVHTDLYAGEGKWKSDDVPTRPEGIQTLNGDIWPSWYSTKTSGVEKVKLTFNKFTKELATTCTKDEYKVTVEATKYMDPITGKEVWTVPNGYKRDKKDDCDYTPDGPTVKLKRTAYGDGNSGVKYSLSATMKKGGAALANYQLLVNGSVVESGEVNSTTIVFQYKPTGNETSIVLKVTDVDGYTGTDTLAL